MLWADALATAPERPARVRHLRSGARKKEGERGDHQPH